MAYIGKVGGLRASDYLSRVGYPPKVCAVIATEQGVNLGHGAGWREALRKGYKKLIKKERESEEEQKVISLMTNKNQEIYFNVGVDDSGNPHLRYGIGIKLEDLTEDEEKLLEGVERIMEREREPPCAVRDDAYG